MPEADTAENQPENQPHNKVEQEAENEPKTFLGLDQKQRFRI